MRRVRGTALLFICMNAAFWLYFWIDVAGRVTPYSGPWPISHGNQLPAYVWFGWGLDYPGVSEFAPSIRLMRVVQQPTLAIVERVVIHVLNRVYPPVYVYQGETFGGLSYAGFQVLLTMVLSFGQWYGIARLLDWVLHKRRA
jgi:hypothetical protein